MRRLPLLFACLFCCHALHAQLPDLTVSGDTLYSPEAKTYQWLRDGVEIPGATERFHVPTAAGSYAVRIRSLDSEAQSFGFGRTLAVAGAVLDEFLRPVAGAEVTVGGRLTQTDADGRFYVTRSGPNVCPPVRRCRVIMRTRLASCRRAAKHSSSIFI